MSRSSTRVRKRVNVSLPEETLRLLDRVAKQGERSALITEAVTAYLGERRRKAFRDRLRQGALVRAERDRRLAEEWFPLEEDAWERGKAAPRRG
jgi:CopG family transcriptional regulator/antitoxin EndoAI